MSEGNLISWAGSQPIWVQVFIGLALFFVGLPLAILLFSELFSAVGTSIASMAKGFSKEEPPRPQAVTQEDSFSDDVLLQALCKSQGGRKTEEQIRDFLSYKSSAEKSALKRNPQVLRAVEELTSEQRGQGNEHLHP